MAEKSAQQSVVADQATSEESQVNSQFSNDSGDYHPEGVAGSLGRAVIAPSVTDTQPSSSRSGLPSRKSSGRKPFGGFGLSMANSSRLSQYSNRSGNNAPTITSSAFFKPLSSSRLQAQRSVRPQTGTRQESVSHTPIGLSITGPASRTSLESDIPQTPHTDPPLETAAAYSRGSDVTGKDVQDREYHGGSLTGHRATQSASESTSPLQPSSEQQTIKGHKENRLSSSFRNNFRGTSPASPATPRDHVEHKKKYYTKTTSSHLEEKMDAVPKSEGKNYEYFTGNTVFGMGGRIQNTRDKPVNIGTGILVILPGVLFFVYWSVRERRSDRKLTYTARRICGTMFRQRYQLSSDIYSISACLRLSMRP